MKPLGGRLKKLRIDKGLFVVEFAGKILVSSRTYREWEYGRKRKGEPYIKIASCFRRKNYSIVTLFFKNIITFSSIILNLSSCFFSGDS